MILQELNIKPAYALLSFFDMREFHFTFQKERKSALSYLLTKPKNSVKIKINISTQHKVTRSVFKRFFTKCFDPNIMDQAAETQILAANFLFLRHRTIGEQTACIKYKVIEGGHSNDYAFMIVFCFQ